MSWFVVGVRSADKVGNDLADDAVNFSKRGLQDDVMCAREVSVRAG